VISPLRFAITSRPSRCEEDLHLQAVEQARHTKSTSEAARAYTSFYELFLDFLLDGDFWEIGACAGEPDVIEYRAEVAPVAAHGAFNGGF
jgi:hypothetical protein